MFALYCIFNVHSGLFVNKRTSLNGLFPQDNDETNLATFNSLLIDPRFLLSGPQLHAVYGPSACRRNGRKKDLHASFILEIDLFHQTLEFSSTYYPTQIWKN